MSRPLTSINEWSDHKLPILRINYAMLKVALVENGYDENRFSVLEPVCNAQNRLETECRKGDWVQVYINALALGIELESIPDINSCEYITARGIDPTPSGSFASLTTALTGANNDLLFTAKERGNDGNAISVTYTVTGNNTPLTVSVIGNDINVGVATGGGGATTSTASQILSAVNGNATAFNLVRASLAPSNTGAGIVTALAKTFLTGGSN